MKNIILGSIAILLATLIAAAMPTEAEARIYEDTLRLHILAASDSKEDQELKLLLRDKILEKYSAVLSDAKSTEAAAEITYAVLHDIERDCAAWIRDAGFSYGVTAELCKEWYETREYEDFSLPRGEYLSLKIKIGKAEGKNWWCVMFPPLCLDISVKAEEKVELPSYTKEEHALISNKKYNVKFKLLELFSDAFFKKG